LSHECYSQCVQCIFDYLFHLMMLHLTHKIYLVTKNQVNITTAKATLTQMLNIIFQRMEIAVCEA
jgi:hypothetical protein